jgi:hypothetical protein
MKIGQEVYFFTGANRLHRANIVKAKVLGEDYEL